MLDETIRRSAWCETSLDAICYFNFRDKYRSLPYIAYVMWKAEIPFKDKKDFLRLFLKSMPPLINIKKFVFNKNMSSINLTNSQLSNSYTVQVQFDVYGRLITKEEIQEIEKVLWENCLWKWKSIDFDVALKVVKDNYF